MESNLPVFAAWEQERRPLALSYEELVRCGAAVQFVLTTVDGPEDEMQKMRNLLHYLEEQGNRWDREHSQEAAKEGK